MKINDDYLLNNEKKKFLFDWFAEFGKFLKEEIDKNDGEYKILAHEKNAGNYLIKEFNLKTNDYSGVYYLVGDKKVLNSIIVKNGKVISYCPLMNYGTDINRPWLINEPDPKSKNKTGSDAR